MPISARDVLFVLRAQDFASREVTKLAGSFGVLGKQMEAVRRSGTARMDEINRGLAKSTRTHTDTLRDNTTHLRTANAAMAARNAEMRHAIRYGDLSEKQIRAHRRAIADNTVTTARNNEVIRRQRDIYDANTLASRRQAEDAKRAARMATEADQERIRSQQQLARRHTATGATMLATGAIMTAVGAGGVAAMAALAVKSAEFRQQIALAQTQAQDLGYSIKDLEGVAYSVGEAIPVPLDELAGGLYDIFSSIDVNLEGSRKLLRQFSRDAVAGQVELEDASRANISVLNAWGRSAEDAGDVSDTMFRLVERGIGTYGEFTNSIGRAIPATVRINENFETLGASMAFLTRQGLSTEMAATAAARAMELVADPRVVSRMEELGFKVRDAHGNFMPLNDIVGQMAVRWKDLPAPERAKEMMDLFAGAGYRIQARRFFDTVIPNYQAFGVEIDRMQDRAGAARRAYITMFEQPQSQLKLLANNASIVANEFGEHLFGALNRVLSVGMSILSWFRSMDPATKSLIVSFVQWTSVGLIFAGVLTAMVGAAKMFYGAMLSLRAVQGLTTILHSANAAMGLHTAAMAKGAGAARALWIALMGPAGVVIALGALAAIAYKVQKAKADEAFVTSSEAAELLAESAGGAYISVQDMGSVLDDAANSAVDFATSNQDTIRSLQELTTEAARLKLIEIGVSLVQRSDLEPHQIQEQLNQLASAAGLALEIPVTIDELTIETAAKSASARIADSFETMWEEASFWTLELSSLTPKVKTEISSLAETISAAFKAGDLTGGVNAWREYEEQVIHSGASAKVTTQALNYMSDEVARLIELTGANAGSTDELATTMEHLAEVLPAAELVELDRALGITRSVAEYAAMGVDVFSSEVQGMPPTLGAAGTALDEFGQDQEDMRSEVEKATEALDKQQDAFRAMVDPLFAARQAEAALVEAQAELDEVMADGESTREERLEAMQALVDAGFDVEYALRQVTAAEADGVNTMATAEKAIKLMADRFGISTEQIQPLIAALEETHGRALTLQELEDIALTVVSNIDLELQRLRELGRVIRSIDGSIIGVRVQRTGGAGTITAGTGATTPWGSGRTQHDGGWAGSGPLGNLFDLKPDEIPTILQQGEFVLSRDMVKMFQSMPRFHEGGGIGPWGGAGTTAANTLSMVKTQRNIRGYKPTEELRAIDDAIAKIESLKEQWEAAEEAAQAASERAEMVRDINAAEDAEQRAEATERLQEWDRARAIAAEKAAVERTLEEAQRKRNLQANADQFFFDQMTTRAQLTNINRRLKAEQAFTDEWMSLMKQRQQLEAELAAERERMAAERQKLIDNKAQWQFEHMTTQQQLREINKRIRNVQKYSDEWMSLARQREQLQDELAQEAERKLDERRQKREQAFETELANLNSMLDEYANAQQKASDAIVSATNQRRSALESEFNLMGEGVMRAQDYADLARAQNEQMQEWHQGLLELQSRGVSVDVVEALGLADSPQELENVRRMLSSTDTELADLNNVMLERQRLLDGVVKEEAGNSYFELSRDIMGIQSDLKDELGSIGKDQGRTWADAISEGIATGLPAIKKQVEEVQRLMRLLKASGVSILPSGEINAASYDSGGVLPPGYTLAYNGTGRNEYVTKSPNSGGNIYIQEGAFQFNGPVDSATLPDVERLLNEFREELADELRSN